MKLNRIFWPKSLTIILLLACLGLAWRPGSAAATDYYWYGLTQDWGDATNWTPSTGPPADGDSAILNPSSTNVAAYNNIFTTAPTLSALSVFGTSGPMTLLLNQTGLAGELKVSTASVSMGRSNSRPGP